MGVFSLDGRGVVLQRGFLDELALFKTLFNFIFDVAYTVDKNAGL